MTTTRRGVEAAGEGGGDEGGVWARASEREKAARTISRKLNMRECSAGKESRKWYDAGEGSG